MNYVDAYLKLDDRASSAESRADEYRQRAEGDRWEQCRIAFDAVDSAAYSQSSFAKAVGRTQQTIRRQCLIWHRYSCTSNRPSYGDAMAYVDGETPVARNTRRDIGGAKAVLKDPELARQVLADPAIRAVASDAIAAHRRAEPAPKPSTSSDDEAFLRGVGRMTRMEQDFLRFIEDINEARKNGYLSPAVLREFAEKLRLWAGAVEDIASSRGLDDDALAEWIGEER